MPNTGNCMMKGWLRNGIVITHSALKYLCHLCKLDMSLSPVPSHYGQRQQRALLWEDDLCWIMGVYTPKFNKTTPTFLTFDMTGGKITSGI